MWLDLFALGILVLFAVLGAAKGGLKTGLGLAALVVGYICAVLLAPIIGPRIAGPLDLSEWLALPLGGTLGFAAGYAAVAVLGALLRRLAERHGDEKSPRDRFLGAMFGAVRGGLVVLLVSWLALWLDALRETGGGVPIPDISGSAAAAVTGEVVEHGSEAAVGDQPGGRMVARIAAHPAAAIAEFEGVLENPNVTALRSDALFWSYVEHGNVDAAMNRSSFLQMERDVSLREQLAGLGLVHPVAATHRAIFRADLAQVLREVGPRIRALREDPALQELVEDPEVVAMLQSGDTMGLLRHPGLRRLVDRVTSSPGESAPGVP